MHKETNVNSSFLTKDSDAVAVNDWLLANDFVPGKLAEYNGEHLLNMTKDDFKKFMNVPSAIRLYNRLQRMKRTYADSISSVNHENNQNHPSISSANISKGKSENMVVSKENNDKKKNTTVPEENGDKKKKTPAVPEKKEKSSIIPKIVKLTIQPGFDLIDLGIIYTDKVDAVEKGSVADGIGVKAGMVMQKINGESCSADSDPFEIIEKAKQHNKQISITFAIKSHVVRVEIPAQYGGGFVTIRAPEGSKSETLVKSAIEKINVKRKRNSLINPSLFRIQFDERKSQKATHKSSPHIALRSFSLIRKGSAPLMDDLEGLGLLSNEKITFEPTRLGLRYTKNIVVEICEGSQAKKKGIEKGWTILKINGQSQPEEENAIYEEIKKQIQAKKQFSILFRTTRFLNTLSNALYNQEKIIQETKKSIYEEELELKMKRTAIEDTLKSLKEQKKKT